VSAVIAFRPRRGRPPKSDHPNTVEARKLRRVEIEHAMRCLYRDPKWIGDMPVADWLSRIHYLDSPRHNGVVLAWLRDARINPLCPVDELAASERDRLIWAMLRFLRADAKR
jgi:hypothetical protein